MSALGGSEKANLEVQHIAASVGPEKGRAPVLNKDLADLTERMKKASGKSVFEADVAQNDEDLMVNFDEMRRVLDDENKRVGAETDPIKKADLQKRYDRLVRRYNVYDKLLNGEGFGAMTVEEQRDMMAVMADLPGFCESVVMATGNRLTIEQVRKLMLGKGGVVLMPDERKVIGEMIVQIASDDKFHARLAKNLTKLKLPETDAADASIIAQKQREIANERLEREAYKANNDIIEAFMAKGSGTADRIQKQSERIDKIMQGPPVIEEIFRPMSFDVSTISSLKASADKSQSDAETIYKAAVVAKGKGGAVDEYRDYMAAVVQAKKVQAILDMANANPNLSAEVDEYQEFTAAKTKRETAERNIAAIEEKKREIASLESKRGTSVSQYKRRMETALSEEMKRYWNEVKLEQAQHAAEAEAQKKAEDQQKEADEKTKRKGIAKALLDKYLYLSFLRYKNGKAVGYDDKALKNFIKKDMLSRSPQELTRDMLRRIYTRRFQIPLTYSAELKSMYTDMGLGTGTPPLTLNKLLATFDKTTYEEWAADVIPNVMGYALDRNFYFDRLKLSPAKLEFLRLAYSDEFLAKALAAKGKHAEQADAMLATGLFTGGAVTQEKIKKMLGGDWVNGSKKIMKTLAVAGAIGAGTYGLLGGFGYPTFAQGLVHVIGAPPAPGIPRVYGSLEKVAGAALGTVRAASRTGENVIGGVAGGISDVAAKIF